MEQDSTGNLVCRAQKSWAARTRTWNRKVLAGAIAQLKKRYKELQSRYGPRYTKAMLSAAFLTLFLPIPGSLLVSVALVVVIAEVHRMISLRGGFLLVVAKAGMPNWATGRWLTPPYRRVLLGLRACSWKRV